MPWILETTLGNALIATAMGMIVVAVSRFLRHRPAVIHAMWLIVLLKLVTPPLVHVPINVGSGTRYASSSALLGSSAELANSSPMGTGASEGRSRANAGHSGSDVITMESKLQRQTAARQLQTKINSAIWSLTLGCWLIGTGVWVTVAAVRIIRFSRLLRVARPCSHDVATIADRVAGRLGMTKTPVIEVVDAHISPLVWHGRRRPRIVLPAELVSKWTDERLELVLAHEIAHVKRGDHWIRWLTLLVLAAYWWHPIAWLAVRRLRVAEEQCCDAMVVAALPGRARAYAETLLATLDLLVARRSPPVLASGIASGGSLKRRCEMILSDQTTFRIGRITGLLLLLSAISILPLVVMVRADDKPAKENAAAQPPDAEKNQPKVDEKALEQKTLEAYAQWIKALEEFDKQVFRLESRESQLEGAAQGLRNLGFDEKLIQALIKDRAKLKDVNQVLQNILRLTDEDEAKPKQGNAESMLLLRTVADDRPSSSGSGSGNRRIAEIIDRAGNKRLKFRSGSTLKIGNHTVTIHGVWENSVIVESDGRRKRWTVGQDFADAVEVGPERPFVDLKTEKSDRQSDSDKKDRE